MCKVLGFIPKCTRECRIHTISDLARPMDGETSASKQSLLLTVPKRGGSPCHRGHAGKH
jgi:hypothetical protein